MNNQLVEQNGVALPDLQQVNPMLAGVRNRSVSPIKKSQFFRQSEDSKEEEIKKGKAVEYGNPDYVCFKIGRLEFFAKAIKFSRHSQYFSKMQANAQIQHAAEEFKEEAEIKQPQIVIRLPKTTLPSVLLLVIKFIDNKFLMDSSMDLETSFHIAMIADELKMRKLESELLSTTIMQLINKQNVLFFLNTTWLRVSEKRKQYRGEVVMMPPSDSDSEQSEKSRKGRRRKKQHKNGSRGSKSGSSAQSSSSQEEIDESEGEQSKRGPKMVQMDMPYDRNEIMEELKESEDNWKELKTYCIDIAANNLNYLMEKQQDDLVNVIQAEVVESIVEKNMQFYRSEPSHDNRSLIDLLKRIKGCKTVFELLKLEKEKILKEQQAELKDYVEGHTQRIPILTWSVNNLTNYFYKQSNSIQIEGANWRLALSYFKKQSMCLKVDIKIINSPFDTKNAKEYFKKQSVSVPANLDVQKIDPMAQFEVEEVDIENQQHRVNQLNATAAKFTNHSFVSFVAAVDLFGDEPLNLPVIHSMICSQKQPVQLISVEDFDIGQLDGQPVNVSLTFQTKEMHSQLLCYISKNFTHLMHEPEIRFLSKEDFKLILRHKFLNVTQEDEVLKAICLWLEGRTLMHKRRKYANVPKASLNMVQGPNADFSSSEASSELDIDDPQPMKKKQVDTTVDLASDLNEILVNVNWDYVTLPCLLDVLRSEPMFRKCNAFRAAIKAQFKIRMNSSSLMAVEAAQNSFNNEPRFSYKYNTSQRNLYPNPEELAAQDRPHVVAKSGVKSQFQLLYPVQLYPDFISHLIDCMISPLDIVKNWSIQAQAANKDQDFRSHKDDNTNIIDQQAIKKRLLQQQLLKKKLEMKHIEDQIQAMDLLDNLHQKPSEQEGENRFLALDDQIEKAKQMFKMRIESKKEEGGGKVNDVQQLSIKQDVQSSSCSDDESPRVRNESSSDGGSVKGINDNEAQAENDRSDGNECMDLRRSLSDCVEEDQKVSLAEESQLSEPSKELSIQSESQDDDNSDKNYREKGAARQVQVQSVSDYDQLKASRGNWSHTKGNGMSERFSAVNSSQSISGDDSSNSVSHDSSSAMSMSQISASSQSVSVEEELLGRLPPSKSLMPSDVANSYRISLESNDQLQYNMSLKNSMSNRYEKQLGTVESSFPLSDERGPEKLKNDVSRHMKAFYKYSSNQVSVFFDKRIVEKETQTEVLSKNRTIIHKETQAQTEIDMEFMVQLVDQISQKDILEKQLHVARVQLFKLANCKKDKTVSSSNSSTDKSDQASQVIKSTLKLEQENDVLSLEIVNDNLAPDINVLDLQESSQSGGVIPSLCEDKDAISEESGSGSIQSVYTPSKSSYDLRSHELKHLRLISRCKSLPKMLSRLPCIEVHFANQSGFISEGEFRYAQQRLSLNTIDLEAGHIKGLTMDAYVLPQQEIQSEHYSEHEAENESALDTGNDINHEVEPEVEVEVEHEIRHDAVHDDMQLAAEICATDRFNDLTAVPEEQKANGIDDEILSENTNSIEHQNSIQSNLQIDIKMPVLQPVLPSQPNALIVSDDDSVDPGTDSSLCSYISDHQEQHQPAGDRGEPKCRDQNETRPLICLKSKPTKIRRHQLLMDQHKPSPHKRSKVQKATMTKRVSNRKIPGANANQAVMYPSEAVKASPIHRQPQKLHEKKVMRSVPAPLIEKFVPSGTRFGKSNPMRASSKPQESEPDNQQKQYQQHVKVGDNQDSSSIQIKTNQHLNIEKGAKNQKGEAKGVKMAAATQQPKGAIAQTQTNNMQNKLSKFLLKHGVAGGSSQMTTPKSLPSLVKTNSGAKPPSAQHLNQQRGASKFKPKTHNTFKASKMQKVKGHKLPRAKELKSLIMPQQDIYAGLEDNDEYSPQMMLGSEVQCEERPFVAKQLIEVSQSESSERKEPETKKLLGQKRLTITPLRNRHQSNSIIEMSKLSPEDTMKFLASGDQTPQTVPDTRKIESLVSINEINDNFSSLLDHNNPYLQEDNSSDIYENGLPSQSSESGVVASSSQSQTTPLSKSDYFTSRDQGLASFNILDHLRQGLSNNNAGSYLDSHHSEFDEDADGEIQLEQLREHHIQSKLHTGKRKKHHGIDEEN